jgi:hypothetical protein
MAVERWRRRGRGRLAGRGGRPVRGGHSHRGCRDPAAVGLGPVLGHLRRARGRPARTAGPPGAERPYRVRAARRPGHLGCGGRAGIHARRRAPRVRPASRHGSRQATAVHRSVTDQICADSLQPIYLGDASSLRRQPCEWVSSARVTSATRGGRCPRAGHRGCSDPWLEVFTLPLVNVSSEQKPVPLRLRHSRASSVPSGPTTASRRRLAPIICCSAVSADAVGVVTRPLRRPSRAAGAESVACGPRSARSSTVSNRVPDMTRTACT